MDKKELIKKIGTNIKKLREMQGISQAELARRCDKDKQAIERIENGKTNPTIYSLSIIAEALEIPLHDLLKI